ncbi:uncharacterized protein DUF550 [Klebsiella oxytoca]|uniref:Uncharacterized protein DUF550 n=1 Tax=Klebsiella oxytoca TaxID=571 RepID=A0A318FH79_KLEOX|nr:uncharacterized protein DUF550 [Klebsiella oxytoca]
MTNNQLTDKRLAQLAKRNFCQTRGEEYTPFGDEVVSMSAELQERRKAERDSEPVAMVDIQRGRGDGKKYALCYTSAGHSLPDDVYNLYVAPQQAPEMTAIVERLNSSGYEYEGGEVTPQNVAAVVDILLQQLDDAVQSRDAQPALERDNVRREHAEWSQAMFGNVGPIGPLKHLSKEAQEAAAEPGDLSEWADMQFLLWDAQRRADISDELITLAMVEKLAVNKQREWPEPKDGEPRLHIK